MNSFKNIGLFTSTVNSEKIFIAKQIEEILSSKGCRILYDNTFKKDTGIKNLKTYSSKYLTSHCDLVIAIGGDGTMLSCSRLYGLQAIPILGINLGKLGFLTDIAPDELTTRLQEVLSGQYSLDQRFFLESTVKGSKKKHIALNEVVIHSGAIAQLIEYDLFIDGVFVFRQKADGIIISSPTGSTAYSLSGGGPIVHPGLEAITLLPMFPQSLSTSPLIVKASSKIKVKLINSKLKSQLSFDSHESLMVKGHQEIIISRSKSELNLIHPKDHDFFEGCRNKLGWSSGLVK